MKRNSHKSELAQAKQTIVTLQHTIVRLATLTALLHATCTTTIHRAMDAEIRASEATIKASTLKARLEDAQNISKSLADALPKMIKSHTIQVNQN